MAEPNNLPYTTAEAQETLTDEFLRRFPYYADKTPGTVLTRLLTCLAYPAAEAAKIIDLWPLLHSLDDAWDYALTLVASNVGVHRHEGEADTWLRERAKLAVFLQHIHGKPEEIRKAIAWFIGIRRQDIEWETTVLPQIKVYLNHMPFWPTEDVVGEGKDLPNFILVTFPWTLTDLWVGDYALMVGDPDSDDPWSLGDHTDKVIYGHHLLLDLVDLADILSMAVVKIRLWGLGNSLIGDVDGPSPWQTTDSLGLSGPVEVIGPDGVTNYQTEECGALIISENDNYPNVFRDVPSNDTFHKDSGQRIFKFVVGATNGGVQWP